MPHPGPGRCRKPGPAGRLQVLRCEEGNSQTLRESRGKNGAERGPSPIAALGSGPGPAFPRYDLSVLLPKPQFVGLQSGDGDGTRLPHPSGAESSKLGCAHAAAGRIITIATASSYHDTGSWAVDQPAHPLLLWPLCLWPGFGFESRGHRRFGDQGRGISGRTYLFMCRAGRLASCPGKGGGAVRLGKLRQGSTSATSSRVAWDSLFGGKSWGLPPVPWPARACTP